MSQDAENPDVAPADETPPGAQGSGDERCPSCGGSGEQDGEACPDCGGTGRVTEAIGGG
jgi:DnaJ-class molecular chaperone